MIIRLARPTRRKSALVKHADVADRYRVAVTGQQRFASAGIVHEKKRTRHEHLTGLSRREASPEMVADGQTYTWDRTPHRVWRDILVVLRHSGEAQLGGAVELGKTRRRKLPSQLRHRAALPFGTGRQDPTHGCKRWHALAHGGLDHQFEHGRYAVDHAHLVDRDQAVDEIRPELPTENDGRPGI